MAYSSIIFLVFKSTRANHEYKLYVKAARVNYSIHFFTRIVKEWNILPKNIVEAETFNLFRSRLKLHMQM